MGISLTASRASVATLAFLASNSSVNTLKIFVPGRQQNAYQNACWGASPNPRRRKVCFVPFPPCGENCTRSLAPPLPTQPASLGLRVDPIGCGPVLTLWALTFGQNVPKQKYQGTAKTVPRLIIKCRKYLAISVKDI